MIVKSILIDLIVKIFFSLLDELYPAVTPKHEAGDRTAFTSHVHSAAEHLLAVVDGKPKEAFGGTYSQIKEVIGKIHESGYLDQAVVSIQNKSPTRFSYCFYRNLWWFMRKPMR